MEALLVLQVIVVVLMIAVILMQPSTSDGFTGGSSTGGGFLSSRGQANLLTKTTGILAAIFIINSLVLAYIATHTQRDNSLGDMIQTQEQTIDGESLTPGAAEKPVPSVPLTE